MAQYDNEKRGALFQNEKRDKPNSPNYTGTIAINGEEFWLSAWVKESKSGKRFLSLSASPKEAPRNVKDDFLDGPVSGDGIKPTGGRGIPDDIHDSDVPF